VKKNKMGQAKKKRGTYEERVKKSYCQEIHAGTAFNKSRF
jgi:hypothetical protein